MTSHLFPITQLAKHINAKIIGDESLIISRLAPIMSAQKGDLTFVTPLYKEYLPHTKASAVILSESDAKECPTTTLIVANPELAYARVAQLWNPVVKPKSGIHPSAVVAKSAVVASTASIGALCVIGEHVKIGANTVIFPGVIIGDDATIGNDCWLYSRVTLYHQVSIAHRVILHSGVVIGSDGFGLVQDKGRFEKIPQLGTVIIGDDVEIGANTCVDRGALKNTVIAHDVKIDDLVMIAHNVEIGAYTVIAGSSAIAGSTTIGAHCIIGGAVTIGGHITVCDDVIFSGCAMVTNSVKEPGIYSSGTGLFPNSVWRKVVARLRRSVR